MTIGVLQIALFGSLRVSVDDRPVTAINTNRLQSLLAWLILKGDKPQPKERIASLIWPESSGPQARTNLRQLLHHLKRSLPPDCACLRSDNFAVHWERDASCVIDVLAFRAAVERAAECESADDPASEIGHLKSAAQLYADDLLPTLYDEWLTPLRQHLRDELGMVLHRLASLLDQQGDVAAAISYATRLVAHDSLGESNYQLLIRLHAANQDRAGALRAYHQCKAVLRRELAVPPGPATVALFESILKDERSTPQQTVRPAPDRKMSRQIIGRVAEMHSLRKLWQTATTDGPTAAILSGEPGIGKTRLAEELLQLVDGRGSAIARTRCYSGHGQAPYAPVAEWLRSEPLRAACQKLTSMQKESLARLAPDILEHQSAPQRPLQISESWQRFQLYESLRAVFAKSEPPLLLFIDDLQWCDPDSLEWLQTLLCSAAGKGIFILGTVRPEETGREHAFTAFLAALRLAGVVHEVQLQPLDAAGTIELARQESAEPLGESKLAEIFRSTRGNPLFVVESARAGLQSTRIAAVISARLAKLSAASYELAGLASVVGRPFSFELLEKLSDWDERSLSAALDELWQRRIIEGRGLDYDFTHDRIREVACAELSLVRVRYLHRRVARALADVYRNDSENWDALIASHYEQAGMVEQAIEHLRLAANSARQRFAEPESAALLRRAVALCRQFPESEKRLRQELELLVLFGAALTATAGYSAPEVGTTYECALELSRRLGDCDVSNILNGLWGFHVVRGDIEASRQVALQFLEAAGENPSAALLCTGNFMLGSALFHLGQLPLSLQHMQSSMAAHGDLTQPHLVVFAGPDVSVFCLSYLAHLTWHCAAEESDTAALQFAAEANRTSERLRHPFSQALALAYEALLHVFRDDSVAARAAGQRAVDLCTRNGFAYYGAFGNVLSGWALAAQGDVTGGLTQLRGGLDVMRSLGAEIRLPYYYALLADACRRAGQLREAAASLSTGFAFAAKNGEVWALSELYRVQGDLSAKDGKPEQAAASYRRGLESASACGSQAFAHRLSNLLERTPAGSPAERF